MKLNESKVLLETSFKDSLGEEEFSVKITDHLSNVVFGECVEVDIRHPEENFRETYGKGDFPDQFFADLERRGWDFVAEKIKESF